MHQYTKDVNIESTKERTYGATAPGKAESMKKMYRSFEKKEGRKYVETFRSEDTDNIYKDFASELMYCKIWKSPIYKKMTDVSNYDGTRTITFYQENGRSIYCIKI